MKELLSHTHVMLLLQHIISICLPASRFVKALSLQRDDEDDSAETLCMKNCLTKWMPKLRPSFFFFLSFFIYLFSFFFISTSFNVAESLETFLMVEAPAAVLPPPQFATKR